MTHPPECFLSEPCHPSLPEHDDLRGELSKCRTCGLPCICDRLRACEQRVLDEAEKIIEDRIHDLATCNKHDDCITRSKGAETALSDIQHWREEEKQ